MKEKRFARGRTTATRTPARHERHTVQTTDAPVSCARLSGAIVRMQIRCARGVASPPRCAALVSRRVFARQANGSHAHEREGRKEHTAGAG